MCPKNTEKSAAIKAAWIGAGALVVVGLLQITFSNQARFTQKMSMNVKSSPGSFNAQAGGNMNIGVSVMPKKRNISGDARRQMIKILQPLRGSKINIVVEVGEAESSDLAGQIYDVFVQASWDVRGIDQHQGGASCRGVCVEVHSGERYARRVIEVKKALDAVGLNPTVFDDSGLSDEDSIRIRIGPQT